MFSLFQIELSTQKLALTIWRQKTIHEIEGKNFPETIFFLGNETASEF